MLSIIENTTKDTYTLIFIWVAIIYVSTMLIKDWLNNRKRQSKSE